MSRIAILDYEAGNLASVLRAVEHLGKEAVITRERGAIRDAGKLLFPGVGAASAAMESLRRHGLDEEIAAAHRAGKPILGICIGCQVIFDESEEDGGTRCLGILPGRVKRFRFPAGEGKDAASGMVPRCKVPHMGWNRVDFSPGGGAAEIHPVFRGLEPGSAFYFVHSFYPLPRRAGDIQGTCEYGGVRFAAAIARGNLAAVQFHAEKSGRPGLRILRNFLDWEPD